MGSTEGIVAPGSCRPVPGSTGTEGKEPCTRGATKGGTPGAAPRMGAVGPTRLVLLTAGVFNELVMLQMKEQNMRPN